MQRGPISFPNKETSLGKEDQTITLLDEWSSILRQSLQSQLVASHQSTSNIKRYSVKKSHSDYPVIPFGTTPLNYYWEPQHHYQDDFFP